MGTVRIAGLRSNTTRALPPFSRYSSVSESHPWHMRLDWAATRALLAFTHIAAQFPW